LNFFVDLNVKREGAADLDGGMIMEKSELTDRLRSKLNYPVPQIKLLLLQEDGNIRNKPVSICTPSDVAEFLEPLQHAAEELFLAIHLNAKSEIMGLHEVSHGTLSSSLVHPREVFNTASTIKLTLC
jgi:hypothetical protein